jgi:hypothetical protein
MTYDQHINGTEHGSSFESSNTDVEISNGSISIGHTEKNVTTSYGFDFKTGAITVGTETESGSGLSSKYGSVKYVVSTESTYNINLPKLAEVAVEGVLDQVSSSARKVASDFQQAASAISSNDINTAATEVRESLLLAATAVVGSIVLLLPLLA